MTASAQVEEVLYGKRRDRAKRASQKGLTVSNVAVSEVIQQNYKRVLENTKGSITAIYSHDLGEQSRKIVQKTNATVGQSTTLRKIIAQFIALEELNGYPLGVNINEATDNEIVISKRTAKGLSLISVDVDGDVTVTFIPTQGDTKTSFFESENYDPEVVVSSFFKSQSLSTRLHSEETALG